MEDEERKAAYKMHRDYYHRVKDAIEKKYYFEAIFLEYAAIESRLEVIMSLMHTPCSSCSDEAYNQIGVSKKMNCYKQFLKNEELFGKSKITKDVIGDIKDWFGARNKRIHNLYRNPEMYDQLQEDTKAVALEGYKFVELFYAEAKRLRRIYHQHPELIENCGFKCSKDVKNEGCKQAIEENSIAQ